MIADINEVPQPSAQVALPFLVRHLAYTSMEFDLSSDTYSLKKSQHTGDGLGKDCRCLPRPTSVQDTSLNQNAAIHRARTSSAVFFLEKT